MHSQEQELQPQELPLQDLQRYLDGELGATEKANVEKHLAECSTCRTRLTELQAEGETLSDMLQSWTLPADLTELKQPLPLPAREAGPQIKPGLMSWLSGIMIVLLFVMARAVFLLSSQLNWVTNLASLLGMNEQFEPFTSSLWGAFQLRPFYLSYLGELGEGVGLILAITLPILRYVVLMSIIMILFFNWFSLTFAAGRPNKTRS